MEGDAKGRIFTFPIPTYNITRDFDWQSEELAPLWKMTAKYGIPYFANFVNSDMKPEDTRSMCCRLRLDIEQVRRRGGGLFGSNPLTGSIGVVTINMSRIGYLSNGMNDFYDRLRQLMSLAKESLELKRKTIERFTEQGLYPYSKFYLSAVKERFGCYWANHFSTIGLIGMNEACLNFLGEDISTIRGKEFAVNVATFMRDELAKFQKETQGLFNLEATPGEGTCYRLARIDREDFPNIIVAGDSEPYYTNSTQLPVDYRGDIFDALSKQDDLQVLYTGGTVFHSYLGEKVDNPESVKLLVKKVTENFHLPYFTITPTFSICPIHGYLGGEHYQCPECGIDTEVYSRVVGYFRPVKQWNKGKREEFRQRKEFVLQGTASSG
jgi:anaerobic ribonucleoside-triphosphate reductase